MKKISIILSGALALVIAFPVLAAAVHGGEKYMLSKNETVDGNLYVGGGDISVSGTVNGDVVSGGGKIIMNGTVRDDVLLGAGSISVRGPVGGDIRAVGGEIDIGETVSGDVALAGGVVRILSNVTVGGDVLTAGGQLIIDGVVNGDITAVGRDVQINGTIHGNIEVHADRLTISKSAVLNGTADYYGKENVVLENGAVLAHKVTFHQSRVRRGSENGFFAGVARTLKLTKLFMLLVAGLLLVLLCNNFSKSMVSEAIQHAGRNAINGFIVLAVTPVALFLLLVSVLGAYVAFVGIAAYIGLILLAKICAGVIAGGLLSHYLNDEEIIDWKWVVIGIVLLQLIGLVPIIGWVVVFIFVLIALGTLFGFVCDQYRSL